MFFPGFHFTWIELVSSGLLLAAFIHQLYFYLRYMRGMSCAGKRQPHAMEQPPVSVIITAKNEEKLLSEHLPKVLEQKYPEFEVIVVNDASDDETEMVLKQLKSRYPHLRSTFVPRGTKNICSKKLAITLGVKAAKYDLLLFTDADCYPESNSWIAHIVRHFTPETEFVLGYGACRPADTFLNRLITYDTLFNAMQYMGLARHGNAYMGTGRNMAYRKDTFFRLKGFSAHLDVPSSDDDLLVSHGSTATNTRIETERDSITWTEAKRTFNDWMAQKARHISSSTKYKPGIKFLLGSEPCSRGVFYLAFPAACIGGNLPCIGIAILLLLGRYAFQCAIVNRTARLYDTRRYYLTLPLFDVLLPLLTLFILLTGKTRKRK